MSVIGTFTYPPNASGVPSVTNPLLTLEQDFDRMQQHYNYHPSEVNDRRKDFYRDGFDWITCFSGAMRRVEPWQRLLNNLGLNGNAYRSVTACKKALKPIFVNIIEYLNHVRARRPGPAPHYKNKKQFMDHMRKCHTRKMPTELVKENKVIGELLEHLA